MICDPHAGLPAARLRGLANWFGAMVCALIATPAPAQGPPPAAPGPSTYVIGNAQVPGARQFATLDEFARGVRCLRGGDRVWLEAGRTLRGRLKLLECMDGSAGASRMIEVRSFDPRQPGGGGAAASPAIVRPSVNAATAGLAWSAVDGSQVPFADPAALRGLAVFRLGPVAAPVAGVRLQGRLLDVAAHPNGRTELDAPRMLPASTIHGRGADCAAALCVAVSDPGWAQVLARLASADREQRPDLLLRNSPWSYSRHRIERVDPGTGRVESGDRAFAEGTPTTAEPEPGSGVTLVGSPALLDAPHEWAHDKASRMVWLVLPASSAAPDAAQTELLVEADEKESFSMFGNAGIAFWGRARAGADEAAIHLRVEHVAVADATGSGIRVHNVGSAELSRVQVDSAGEHGISVVNALGQVVVQDSVVRQAAKNGIALSRGREARVLRNEVRMAGQLRQQAALGMDFNGIRISAFPALQVAGNRIEGTGFAGIMVSESGDESVRARSTLEIRANQIRDFCRILNDCGGIYVNGQTPAGTAIKPASERRKVVADNRLEQPRGNLAGLALQSRPKPPKPRVLGDWERMVAAIYLDHGASGFDVHGNTATGVYQPYGWRIFNRGVDNSCGVDQVERCRSQASAYACYTSALDNCNTVPALPRR
jgi:hypothetical protein